MTKPRKTSTLAKMRQAAGLTQAEVADYIGIAQSTLSCWEIGKRRPSHKSLLKLGSLYRTPWRDLQDTAAPAGEGEGRKEMGR